MFIEGKKEERKEGRKEGKREGEKEGGRDGELRHTVFSPHIQVLVST